MDIAKSEKRIGVLEKEISNEKSILSAAKAKLKDSFTAREIKSINEFIEAQAKLIENFDGEISAVPSTPTTAEEPKEAKSAKTEVSNEAKTSAAPAKATAPAPKAEESDEDHRLKLNKQYVQGSYNKGRSDFIEGAPKNPPYGKNQMRNNAYILGYEEAEEAKKNGTESSKLSEKNSADRINELASFQAESAPKAASASAAEKSTEPKKSKPLAMEGEPETVAEVFEHGQDLVDIEDIESTPLVEVFLAESQEATFVDHTENSQIPEEDETGGSGNDSEETSQQSHEITANDPKEEAFYDSKNHEADPETEKQEPVNFDQIKTEIQTNDEDEENIPSFLRR